VTETAIASGRPQEITAVLQEANRLGFTPDAALLIVAKGFVDGRPDTTLTPSGVARAMRDWLVEAKERDFVQRTIATARSSGVRFPEVTRRQVLEEVAGRIESTSAEFAGASLRDLPPREHLINQIGRWAARLDEKPEPWTTGELMWLFRSTIEAVDS
jgi:hypothetical protein